MNRLQHHQFFLVTVVLALWAHVSWAEENDSEQPKDPRAEYIELASQLDREFNASTTKMVMLEKTLPLEKFGERFGQVLRDGFAAKEIQELLDFEARHRSSFWGLMALRKVLLYAHRFGPPRPAPTERGKREVLKRLTYYVTLPIAAETVSETLGGFPDRKVGPALRAIIVSEKAKPPNREAARLALAQWLMSWDPFVKQRKKQSEFLVQLKKRKNHDAKEFSQRNALEALLDSLPSDEENLRWQREAESILAELEASDLEVRIPEVKAIGRHIVRIDLKATKKKATIAELAQATRFNRIGRSVGDLSVDLIDGNRWSLKTNAGKVVVIQFSFTGCAPCVKMYAELAELQSEHPDDLSLLTVMQDPQQRTTKDAAAKYGLSWPVYWDGDPGSMTQRWAVRSFPTVVVLNRHGEIAGRSLEIARELLDGNKEQ